MQNFCKILLLFYRPLLVWNLLFSVTGFSGILLYGAGFTGVFFIIKLLGYTSSVWFQYYFSNKTFYYYRNAGYTVRSLYLYVFLVDILANLIFIGFYLAFLSCCHVKS